MSKDNETMKQHIIPRAHLKRFTDKDGFLYVHRLDDINDIKCFKQKPDKVSCEVNYYDDDPYGNFSIEKYLKREEDKGQPIIDNIIESKLKESDCAPLIRYLSMIINRSRIVRDSYHNIISGNSWINFDNCQLTDEDPVIVQLCGLLESKDEMIGSPLSDYNCILLKSNSQNQLFVTGDVPFAFIHLHLDEYILNTESNMEKIGKISSYPGDPWMGVKTEYLRQQLISFMNDSIIVCTLSSNVCLIAYKEPYDKFIVDLKNTLGANPIGYINERIINLCEHEVYANKCFKKEIIHVKKIL